MPGHRLLDPCTLRSLAVSVLAVLALPWLIGAWAKTGLQPGLADDAARASMLVDFIVAGATLFGLAMVVVFACGCWIVGVMKGPQRRGDPFPSERERQP